MIQALTLLCIGAVGGFLSGLLGIGGGVILIPLLIYVANVSIKVATSVSVVAIIFASSSAVLAHYRRGNVHALAGAWMGVASISSALGGSFLSGTFSDNFLYYLYMGVVAGATIMLLLPRPEDTANPPGFHLSRLPMVFAGLVQGFLTGVLGIGGGFIVVPLMIHLTDMPAREAVGTSLVVVLFSAMAGFVGKLAIGHFELSIIIWVVLGMIPAAQVGAWAAQKSSPRLLRLFLVILLIGILVWMIRGVAL